MRSIQHPCRYFKTILQPFARKITLTNLAAETIVSSSDEDLLAVEVMPRIANFPHLVLWGIVLCTSITTHGHIDPLTTTVPCHGRSNYPTAAKSSSCPWSAVCIITTCGKLLEAQPTTDPPGQTPGGSSGPRMQRDTSGCCPSPISFGGRHSSQVRRRREPRAALQPRWSFCHPQWSVFRRLQLVWKYFCEP